jgi:hypothetical protein
MPGSRTTAQGTTRVLARFAADLRYADLPSEAAKLHDCAPYAAAPLSTEAVDRLIEGVERLEDLQTWPPCPPSS